MLSCILRAASGVTNPPTCSHVLTIKTHSICFTLRRAPLCAISITANVRHWKVTSRRHGSQYVPRIKHNHNNNNNNAPATRTHPFTASMHGTLMCNICLSMVCIYLICSRRAVEEEGVLKGVCARVVHTSFFFFFLGGYMFIASCALAEVSPWHQTHAHSCSVYIYTSLEKVLRRNVLCEHVFWVYVKKFYTDI